MPLTKAQSILKRCLPERCFAFLYGLSCRGYKIWQKTADAIYYLGSGVYYVLRRDARNAKRLRAIRAILPYTMVGRTGLLATYDIADGVEKRGMVGCFVECGVAKGGCSALMAMVARENKSGRKIWLFDSFEGLPEQTSQDEYQEPIMPKPEDKSASLVAQGYCLGTFDEVETLLFSKLGLSRDNVFMVKGWFEETLPAYRDKVGTIAILRIDADWYESIKCCLENFYDNVIAGGYIIIDDYGSVIGCKKAADEFLKNKKLNVNLSFDDRGGCYFVKPC
jgi:O-methyltransferase